MNSLQAKLRCCINNRDLKHHAQDISGYARIVVMRTYFLSNVSLSFDRIERKKNRFIVLAMKFRMPVGTRPPRDFRER